MITRHYLPAMRAVSIRRLLSTSTRLWKRPPFSSGPAPPRLPEEDQKEFEELQKASTGAFSTPRSTVVTNESAARQRPKINQSPQSEEVKANDGDADALNVRFKASGEGEELHPDIRRGAQPEFEGDRNPKTGEIGGPKNDPLRWGANVDWSYNGRVTDF